jgi:hypothetical protein
MARDQKEETYDAVEQKDTKTVKLVKGSEKIEINEKDAKFMLENGWKKGK